MNLRISGFRTSLSKENVIDILEDELRKLAPFEVCYFGEAFSKFLLLEVTGL